jgi:sarcosine oxidase, subunit gamma
MPEATRTCPLHDLAAAGRPLAGPQPVTLTVMPPLGRMMLRGGDEVRAEAGAALRVRLPDRAYGSVHDADTSVFWLQPDGWLVVCAAEREPEVWHLLRAALAGLDYALVSVGHRFVGLVLTGERVLDVLAAGCPIDLHPSVFPAGHVTRTLLGKAEITLYCRDEAPTFELLMERSFAAYVWHFLQTAAREFGYRVEPLPDPAAGLSRR